jgi:hypothetical protein
MSSGNSGNPLLPDEDNIPAPSIDYYELLGLSRHSVPAPDADAIKKVHL